MFNRNKLSLLLALALGVAGAGRASADHDHDRDGSWKSLARVGTHVHDEEDFVNVQAGTHLDAVQLRAEQSTVSIDGVRVHYADGHDERVDIHRQIRPGEPLTIDIPRSDSAVKTLVLDYGNKGPYWRARETAHLEVLGLVDDGLGDRTRDRLNDKRDRARPPADRGAQYRVNGVDRARTTGDRTDTTRTRTRTRAGTPAPTTPPATTTTPQDRGAWIPWRK